MRWREGYAAARQKLFVPTLMLLAAVSPLVSSLGAPLVPMIADLFDVSLTAAQWSLTAPLIVGAVSAPVIGRLGEGSRRRPVVVATMMVVLVGTVLSALPLGFVAFLLGRVAQGLGLGLLPMAMSIARDSVAPDRRHATVASISISATVGAGIGFPLSTMIASVAGVHGAYVVGLVMCLGIVVLALVAVPAKPGAKRSVDVLEAALLGLGMTAVLLGVSQGNSWGWGSREIVGCFAGGAVLLLLWICRALPSPAPMIDLRLSRAPPIVAVGLTAVLTGACMYAVMALAIIVVQAPQESGGLGLHVFVSGLLMLPYSLAGWCGVRIARRSGRSPEGTLAVGCAGFSVSLLILAVPSHSVWGVAVAMAVAGLGGGCAFAALPLVVLRHVDAPSAASALSANHVLRSLGFAAGSALSVALVAMLSGNNGQVVSHGVGVASLVTSSLGLVALVVTVRVLRPGRSVVAESASGAVIAGSGRRSGKERIRV